MKPGSLREFLRNSRMMSRAITVGATRRRNAWVSSSSSADGVRRTLSCRLTIQRVTSLRSRVSSMLLSSESSFNQCIRVTVTSEPHEGGIMDSSLTPTAPSVPVSPSVQAVTIRYRNYRGETAIRHIRPSHIWFGSTSWHPEPQWVLEAIDLDKDAPRSFAMSDILNFDCSELDVSH